jgi:hypothetical protein
VGGSPSRTCRWSWSSSTLRYRGLTTFRGARARRQKVGFVIEGVGSSCQSSGRLSRRQGCRRERWALASGPAPTRSRPRLRPRRNHHWPDEARGRVHGRAAHVVGIGPPKLVRVGHLASRHKQDRSRFRRAAILVIRKQWRQSTPRSPMSRSCCRGDAMATRGDRFGGNAWASDLAPPRPLRQPGTGTGATGLRTSGGRRCAKWLLRPPGEGRTKHWEGVPDAGRCGRIDTCRRGI